MLDNIEAVENLRGVARARARDYETKTVDPLLVEQALAEGWQVAKRNKRTVALTRKKPHGKLLEDRVWSLFYRMGFAYMSSTGGGILLIDPKNTSGPKTQIDVVAIDNEVAIAIECKSSEKHSKRSQFQEELGKHSLIRERFVSSVNAQFAPPSKRQAVIGMFLSQVILSDNDRARAREANVVLFDEADLAYYERLVSHLGPAAKYQLLADMLPGKTIQGLSIRVPAVKTKMGGYTCYTFSINPEYLLKISYVSHRTKGKASDVNTYQRMLTKSRLNQIRQYISNDGIFPTNIVINLEKYPNRIRFERIHQGSESGDTEHGVMGWLDIRAAYKSAWIIDGQHRLFAYSGHDRASKGRLSVLAFEGLPPSKQAELFIDINAKQKSVNRSLLQELYAELNWDAKEPEARVGAIISKAIQGLDADPSSALFHRIQTADAAKDPIRCITLTSVFSAVERADFFISKQKEGHVIEYGPLWGGDNDATLKRTMFILKQWLELIRGAVPDWWDKGAGPGGGLAMNDGVTTCINVLSSVFRHLDAGGQKLLRLDDDDLFSSVKKYGDALSDYLASLSEEERKQFRDLRGGQGQLIRTRRCQQAIRNNIPSFDPPGLAEFIRQEKAQTNIKAKAIVDRIETTLQRVILDELKREYGADESQWWMLGIPKPVRLKVTQRFEDDDGKRGGREYYFDLIDYRDIAHLNWNVFEPILAYGKGGSKDKRTSWMSFINERRKLVAHASAAMSVSIEDLNELELYDKWLEEQIKGGQIVDDTAAT
ncbi:MAG: DGQHR domain-containing protein [Chloroflexota bacterium]|nr:DGQHR domain-containing protein [Chloroflexota bacterium]